MVSQDTSQKTDTHIPLDWIHILKWSMGHLSV
jgi:hypothetical protein